MILGNHFTLAFVFGSYRKLGHIEFIFCVDCKIPYITGNSFSGFILPSNDFHPKKIEEREREREKQQGDHTRGTGLVVPSIGPNPRLHRSRRTPAQARSRCLKHHRDRIPALPRSHSSTAEIAPQHQRDCTHSHCWKLIAIAIWIVATQDQSTQNRSRPRPKAHQCCCSRSRSRHRSCSRAPSGSAQSSLVLPSSIHSNLSLSRSISLSLNLSHFLPLISPFLPLAQCFYFDFWLC